MRTGQSILATMLAIALISCQSSPQVPVQPRPTSPVQAAPADVGYPYGTDPYQDIPAAPDAAAGYAPSGGSAVPVVPADKSGKADAKKKGSIKPIIGSVSSGLLSPLTQEIPPGAPLPPQKERQRIVFNFEKADIGEVTSQIFGDQLKLSFVTDQTLQGRISMYIEGDFDSQELLQMVTRAYEANGLSVTPRKGFYFIQASQKAGSGLPIASPLLLKEGKEAGRPLIVIYRLRYMDPKQAANLISPFLSPGKKVIGEPLTNSLIFIEDTENARSLVNLLKTIDINILKEISMEIVPLKSIAPQDAVQGMESLMNKLGGFKESAIKNSLAFIPLQSYGGVLVMAQNPELLKSARQWLQALDVQGAGSVEEIYVYFVQNGLARDIADILNGVYGLGGGGGTRRMEQQVVPSGRTASRSAFGGSGFGSGSSGSSFGRSGSSSSSSGMSGSTFGSSSSRLGSSGSGTGTSGSGTGTGTGTGTSAARASGGTGGGTYGKTGQQPSIFSGEVMIIADEINNAIVVRANAVDYAKIKKTMESLDILPRAVLIEVMIAEIRLIKDFQYGLKYFFEVNGFGVSFGGVSKNGTASTATSTTGTSTSLLSGFPDVGTLAGAGLGLSWIASAQNMAVFLNALSSKTTVNVLSSPTLLATDNKEATITVGGREPVPTGSFNTAGGTLDSSVFSTIQYEETGVILNVTPHINAGGLVRLEVEQTIRRVDNRNVTVGANNTAPSFTERNVKTTVLAQSGTTAVIGGIIDSGTNRGRNGIPFLQNIPLFSPLFSAKTESMDRTELIVAITPHVVDQRGTEAPRELLQKLQHLRGRIGQ
ncbi:MAG: type II secretion system secretin GspD [Syntrophobacteraceae bacterium]